MTADLFQSEKSINMNLTRMNMQTRTDLEESKDLNREDQYIPNQKIVKFYQELFQQKVTISKTKALQEKRYHRYKIVDTICAITALFMLCVIYYENEQAEIEKVRTGIEIYWARILIIFLTVIIDICLILRYNLKKKLSEDISPNKSILKTRYIFYLFLELLLCSICMPPNVHEEFKGRMLNGTYVYSYAQVVNIVSIFKTSYLMSRIYFHYCIWRKNENGIAAKSQNLKIDLRFSLKAELKYHPITVVVICALTTVFYIGFAIRNLEIGFEPDDGESFQFQYVANSLWLTIVTMTTVGYGDMYPQTHMGRAFAVCSFIFGNFLTSFITVILTTKADLTEQEHKAYCMIK
mmetsp:Transcript_23136/g.20527  ORF Transcript_23136/g.20527 Transcript_23136/m.20527 type:complete len:350 (+) Transcript_23136:282-1331(+)